MQDDNGRCNSGLPEMCKKIIFAASRVIPTGGDKPGHDEFI
jgi:hypothetical protein